MESRRAGRIVPDRAYTPPCRTTSPARSSRLVV